MALDDAKIVVVLGAAVAVAAAVVMVMMMMMSSCRCKECAYINTWQRPHLKPTSPVMTTPGTAPFPITRETTATSSAAPMEAPCLR